MYIIVKGKVVYQYNRSDLGNLPMVIATINDGEKVGQLQSGESGLRHHAAICVEDTDLLVFNRSLVY